VLKTGEESAENPAAEMRFRLAHARESGVAFPLAWAAALEALRLPPPSTNAGSEPAQWHAALRATRDDWQSAYEGTGQAFSLFVAEPEEPERRSG